MVAQKFQVSKKTLEKEYGLNLQVAYADKKGAYYTSGDLDDMTLTQLNKFMEENGYTLKPKIK